MPFGEPWGPFGFFGDQKHDNESVSICSSLLNTVFFKFLVDCKVTWNCFSVPFGHLLEHGCECENSAGACMGARFSRFMGGQDRFFLRALRERRFERPLLKGFVPI